MKIKTNIQKLKERTNPRAAPQEATWQNMYIEQYSDHRICDLITEDIASLTKKSQTFRL